MSNQFIFSSNNTDWTTSFEVPIGVECQYEIALLNLETFNAIPNIDKTNNMFYYIVPDGNPRTNSIDRGIPTGKQKIELPVGSYDVNDINQYIQKTMKLTKQKQRRKKEVFKLTISLSGQWPIWIIIGIK